ncbi:MAG: sarcosine oxidase subunit gamma [Rhizorhabdus sp.]|nr:sarcosine oxidase subunit gamma [Rhizorhabdus sp.]
MAELLDPQGAFADRLARLPVAPPEHELVVQEAFYGLATVMARAGQREALGPAFPDGPHRSDAYLGIGPGTWLAVGEGASPYWAAALGERLSGLASVVDQSSGYAVLRIGGAAARDLLSRGAFIDFHDFGSDRVAVTGIAHMGVILWRRGEVYEVAMFRSYAGSFWDWLLATAAGMGVAPHTVIAAKAGILSMSSQAEGLEGSQPSLG